MPASAPRSIEGRGRDFDLVIDQCRRANPERQDCTQVEPLDTGIDAVKAAPGDLVGEPWKIVTLPLVVAQLQRIASDKRTDIRQVCLRGQLHRANRHGNNAAAAPERRRYLAAVSVGRVVDAPRAIACRLQPALANENKHHAL